MSFYQRKFRFYQNCIFPYFKIVLERKDNMCQKIGVIITIQKYVDMELGLSEVDYASHDGEEIKKVFINIFKIAENDIFVFQDSQCTINSLRSQLEYNLKMMSNDYELYVYYAGHGFFLDGINYLTLYDTSLLDPKSTSITIEDLFMNYFKLSKAKSCIAFIDACAEALSSNSRGINIREMDVRSEKSFERTDFKYALLFSCSPFEKSISREELQHGVWTYYLLQALNGQDENAFDTCGNITVNSLTKYLKKSVIDYTKRINHQTPYNVISSNGDWILVKNNKQKYPFDQQVVVAVQEYIEFCNFSIQDMTIGTYGDINSFNEARNYCYKISDILNSFCPDWENILSELEFYYRLTMSGKEFNISPNEQEELMKSVQNLIFSIPCYLNDTI